MDIKELQGLTHAEAAKRLKVYGKNKIEEKRTRSIAGIFLSQFTSPVIWMLAFAAALSLYFREWIDAMVILAVIFINTLIGFFMETRAMISMNALKKMAAVPAKVIREKKMHQVNSEEIVPGDILFMEAGDMVAA